MSKIRIGKYEVEEGQKYIDQHDKLVYFIKDTDQVIIHHADGRFNVGDVDTHWIKWLKLTPLGEPLEPIWEPRAGQLVYVSNYEGEWRVRRFIQMDENGWFVCDSESSCASISTWTLCKPIPQEDIV